MANPEVSTTIRVNTKDGTDVVRPHANFPASIWGDRFLNFSLDNLELEVYSKATKELQEEVRMLIVDPTMEPNAKISLINCVYRLGMKYLFIEEISCELDQLFEELNLESYDEVDLYTISVHFQVFRQHGYKLSSDVFNKFKDSSSGQFMKYITNDVKGMLSLFESTQLRIRGESILDEALAFTEAQLKSVVNTLDGNLERQVRHALRSPFHRGLRMVEARLYFSNYQDECSMFDPLLKLANAHFNYLQLLHKEDLRKITQWSKDMEFQTITPYARDRIPDLYLWGLGLFYEPHYSQARLITTKMAQLICVLDDTYDAYATIEELQLLTDALNSWEISATEKLPDYMKPLYKIFLNEHSELEKQLSKEGGASSVTASKQAFQELAAGYLKEAEWRHSGEVPSFQEYLKNGLVTSTYNVFAKSSLMGLGEAVTKEALAWYESHPKILEATRLSGRLYNDVATFQFERQRGQQQVTSIEAYMKTFGVSENVAVDELLKMIDNAWKDINEVSLKPTAVSMEVLAPIVNLARMTDVIYRCNDKFTFPEKTIQDYITLLFVDSI